MHGVAIITSVHINRISAGEIVDCAMSPYVEN